MSFPIGNFPLQISNISIKKYFFNFITFNSSRHDREAEYIINLDLSDEVTQSRERGMTAGTFEP